MGKLMVSMDRWLVSRSLQHRKCRTQALVQRTLIQADKKSRKPWTDPLLPSLCSFVNHQGGRLKLDRIQTVKQPWSYKWQNFQQHQMRCSWCRKLPTKEFVQNDVHSFRWSWWRQRCRWSVVHPRWQQKIRYVQWSTNLPGSIQHVVLPCQFPTACIVSQNILTDTF